MASAEEDVEHDIVAYARLAAALAAEPVARAELLAARGLDEARWAAIDDAWQARLSAAMDEATDGVPPLVAAYADAFARAQREAAAVLPLERFIAVLFELRRGREAAAVLAEHGITLAELLRASEHWSRRAASDAAVALRIAAIGRAGGG